MIAQEQSIVREHTLAINVRFLAIGLMTGFTSSLFAAGGAPVIVYGLLWLCSYNMKETTGPALATLAAGALVGFGLRLHLNSLDLQIRMAMMMLPFGITGVMAGHFIAKHWSSKALQEFFSCFVIFIGLKMMGVSFFPTLSVPQGTTDILLYGTAFLAGLGSRILGTGGGLITVPVLMYAGLVPHQALITSLALNIPMMLLGAGLNFGGKSPKWKELCYLVPGAMLGASVGAYVSYMYVPDVLLRTLFGGLLIGSTAMMLLPRLWVCMHAFMHSYMIYMRRWLDRLGPIL